MCVCLQDAVCVCVCRMLYVSQVGVCLLTAVCVCVCRMLDEFGQDMDHTETRLDLTMKKMAKVMHMSNGRTALFDWPEQHCQPVYIVMSVPTTV